MLVNPEEYANTMLEELNVFIPGPNRALSSNFS